LRAVIVRRFGDPDVLEYHDVADPEPGVGEVRIAVRAAGANPVDAGNRTDGTWAGIQLPWVPGYEVAGVVESAGPDPGNLSPGQRVVAMTGFPARGGGYAELAVVAARDVVPLDGSVSFAAAATAPVAAGTAWEVLERLRLARGSRLLVLGASGGVGSYLLQLAALRDIATVAVGSRKHHGRLRRLGALACVDYADGHGADDLLRAGQGGQGGQRGQGGVDAIADLVGGPAVGPWLAALRQRGQIASIEPPELDLGALVDANITFHGVLVTNSAERTRVLADLLAAGGLTAHIARVLPLAEAKQAHRLLESRHAGGKIVLIPDGG
jgi:NADPH:quinone reductase